MIKIEDRSYYNKNHYTFFVALLFCIFAFGVINSENTIIALSGIQQSPFINTLSRFMFPFLFLVSLGLGKKLFKFYSSKMLFEDICLIIFCTIVIISELFLFPGEVNNLGRPILFLLRFVIPFYVLSFCFRNKIVPNYTLILCILILLSICLPLFLNYDKIKYLGETERLKFAGVGTSPTATGAFVTGSLLFTLYVFLLSSKKITYYYKLLTTIVIVIIMITLWMLFKLKTRGCWLYMFITFVVYFFLRKSAINKSDTKNKNFMLKAALLCTTAFLLIGWDLICQIDFFELSPEKIVKDLMVTQRFSGDSLGYDQTYGRLYIWEKYFNYFSSSSFGFSFTGSGFPKLGASFAEECDNSIRGIAPHNAVFGIWLLYGFFGLLFYLLLHLSIFYRAFKTVCENRSKETIFAFAILVGGIVPFLTENYFFLNTGILSWLWYILGGIFVNKYR